MNQMETPTTDSAPVTQQGEPVAIPTPVSPPEIPSGVAVNTEASPDRDAPTAVDGTVLQNEWHALRGLFDTIVTRLTALESLAESTSKQLGFLPPQVRALGSKIESVSASLSDSRYRGLLLNVLLIFDLVDQPLRASPSAPGHRLEGEHRRNYEVLRTQLRQILEANGLSDISTEGAFDPEWQRALESVSTDDPANAGMVCRVLRPGFRAANSVLRYAEVSVWSEVSDARSAQSPPDNTTELAAGSTGAETRHQTFVPVSSQPDEEPGEPILHANIRQTDTNI